MTTYIKMPEPTQNANYIRIAIEYYKGSDYSVGQKRGYYLIVYPVLREGRFESFVCYSGAKMLLKEVSRKSAKQESEAIEIAKQVVKSVVESVCQKQDLEIPEEIALQRAIFFFAKIRISQLTKIYKNILKK